MPLLYLSLLSVIILYFFFALLPFRICAICAAVSLTWLGLLILYFLGMHHDTLLLGIMMGGSVVGVMYKLEKYFKSREWVNYWFVRLWLIVLGFSSVYFIIKKEWDGLSMVVILGVLCLALSLFVIKPAKKTGEGEEKKSWIQDQLEHCCD